MQREWYEWAIVARSLVAEMRGSGLGDGIPGLWTLAVLFMCACSGRPAVLGDALVDSSKGDLRRDVLASDRAADAVGDASTCVPEGKFLVDPQNEKCCFGFIPVLDKIATSSGACQESKPRRYLCTQCGDDRCVTGETICNCPKDCSCYGQGDQFENSGGSPAGKCCSGLSAVKVTLPTSAGTCAPMGCDCYVCLKCGDQVCGRGEDECTCLIDCPP